MHGQSAHSQAHNNGEKRSTINNSEIKKHWPQITSIETFNYFVFWFVIVKQYAEIYNIKCIEKY